MPHMESDNSDKDSQREVQNVRSVHSEPAIDPDEDSATIVTALTVATSVDVYRGPLPPPEAFAQYEATLPGTAERILAMAERQAAHDQSVEKAAITGGSVKAYLGLVIGALLAFFFIACGTFLVYNDHDWAGATMIVSSLVGLVSVFVYATQTRRAEIRKDRRSSEFTSEHRDEGGSG